MRLQRMTRMAVLLAAAVVLYRFSFSLPFFPPFLKYDASEVPVVVGTLLYGPLAGLVLELLKNLLHALIKGGANPVGLAANFLAGTFLLFSLYFAYGAASHRVTRWAAVAGSALFAALCLIPLNVYVFLPAHGVKASALVQMALGLLTPFNLAKGVLSGGMGMVLFERLSLSLSSTAGARDMRG